MCNSDEITELETSVHASRASFLTDTLFVAVVERQLWVNGTRWGDHVLATESSTTTTHRIRQTASGRMRSVVVVLESKAKTSWP